MRDFKRIKAWLRARALSVEVHAASRRFGRAGHARLRDQLTRAVDSIAANIAEGCGAASNKDFARFLDTAIKSANEAEHHFLCARDFKLFSPEKWKRYNDEVIEIRKMIIGYRKRVLSDAA